MGVHTSTVAQEPHSAAFAEGFDVEAALFMHQPAMRAGLTGQLLTCARRYATFKKPTLALIERHLRLVGRAQRAPAGSLLATLDIPDESQSAQLVLWRQRLREQTWSGDAHKGTKGPTAEVVEAASALIAFVQRTLVEEAEGDDRPAVINSRTVAESLRATQLLGFEALWTPRNGYGLAKAAQIEVADGKPLAICEEHSCGTIFDDNPKNAGKSLTKIRPFCPKHKK